MLGAPSDYPPVKHPISYRFSPRRVCGQEYGTVHSAPYLITLAVRFVFESLFFYLELEHELVLWGTKVVSGVLHELLRLHLSST